MGLWRVHLIIGAHGMLRHEHVEWLPTITWERTRQQALLVHWKCTVTGFEDFAGWLSWFG